MLHLLFLTKLNPVQVFVNAIENAAPREEVTRLKYGGIAVPKAVDVSPSRRVDVVGKSLIVDFNPRDFIVSK